MLFTGIVYSPIAVSIFISFTATYVPSFVSTNMYSLLSALLKSCALYSFPSASMKFA